MLSESQIDDNFKQLFKQLAGGGKGAARTSSGGDAGGGGDTSGWWHGTAGEHPVFSPQDMEISVTELQTILNRIIGKREPLGGILGVHHKRENNIQSSLIILSLVNANNDRILCR